MKAHDEILDLARKLFVAATRDSESPVDTQRMNERWDRVGRSARELWVKVALAARHEVAGALTDLTAANKAQADQIEHMEKSLRLIAHRRMPVTLDYVNHEGVRAERSVAPMGLDYGTTEYHPSPGFIMPCWDFGRDAFRLYDVASIRAWNGQKVEAAGDANTRISELETALAEATERYLAAVRGRAEFRQAFRVVRKRCRNLDKALHALAKASEPDEPEARTVLTTETFKRAATPPEMIRPLTFEDKVGLIRTAYINGSVLTWVFNLGESSRRRITGRVDEYAVHNGERLNFVLQECERRGAAWVGLSTTMQMDMANLETIESFPEYPGI